MPDSVSQAAAIRRAVGRALGGGPRNVTAKNARKLKGAKATKRAGSLKTSRAGRAARSQLNRGARVT